MKKEPTYNERVFTFLDRMEAGTMELTKLCTPETRDKFIKTVQSYIDQKGIYNGYCTEFNSNMTAIKKFDTIMRTSIEKFKETI